LTFLNFKATLRPVVENVFAQSLHQVRFSFISFATCGGAGGGVTKTVSKNSVVAAENVFVTRGDRPLRFLGSNS
jgi:hypothetical protein